MHDRIGAVSAGGMIGGGCDPRCWVALWEWCRNVWNGASASAIFIASGCRKYDVCMPWSPGGE
jgi:hypothetical protein